MILPYSTTVTKQTFQILVIVNFARIKDSIACRYFTKVNYVDRYLIPGVSSPFTFASGVTLTAPIPNSNSGALVGDFSIRSADWGVLSNSVVSSSDVSDGTAYLGFSEGAAIRSYRRLRVLNNL